jgi:hypothetical protein
LHNVDRQIAWLRVIGTGREATVTGLIDRAQRFLDCRARRIVRRRRQLTEKPRDVSIESARYFRLT